MKNDIEQLIMAELSAEHERTKLGMSVREIAKSINVVVDTPESFDVLEHELAKMEEIGLVYQRIFGIYSVCPSDSIPQQNGKRLKISLSLLLRLGYTEFILTSNGFSVKEYQDDKTKLMEPNFILGDEKYICFIKHKWAIGKQLIDWDLEYAEAHNGLGLKGRRFMMHLVKSSNKKFNVEYWVIDKIVVSDKPIERLKPIRKFEQSSF